MVETEVDTHPLREWQSTLIEELKLPPNPRTIKFVVDTKGIAGKTWFAKYYQQVYGDSFRLTPSCRTDMIYAIHASLKQYHEVPYGQQWEQTVPV